MTCPCKDLSGPGDAIEVCTQVSAGELNHKLMEPEDGAGGGPAPACTASKTHGIGSSRISRK